MSVAPMQRMLSPQEISEDVNRLRKAMKGMGTDEKAIIEVLAHRSDVQLQQISQAYLAAHGKSLQLELKGEINGDFLKFCLTLVNPMAEADALMLEKAMKGLGTDEGLLIQVLCGRTNAEVHAIKSAYQHLFQRDLNRDISKELSGLVEKFFMGVLLGNRNETGQGLDLNHDLQILYKAGEGKLGTDEQAFLDFFTTRSDMVLNSCFHAYEQQHKKSVIAVIQSEFSGDIQKVLMNAAELAINRGRYFARRLNKAMEGLGTNDLQLQYLIARCRDPVVMHEVKKAYLELYTKTLYDHVKAETSGNYEKLLLAIIGN